MVRVIANSRFTTVLPWGPVCDGEVSCHVQIAQLPSQEVYVVIFNQLPPPYEGMSVTNASEYLATAVVRDYTLPYIQTMFFEHYPGQANYDQINYTWSQLANGTWIAASPDWSFGTIGNVQQVLGAWPWPALGYIVE